MTTTLPLIGRGELGDVYEGPDGNTVVKILTRVDDRTVASFSRFVPPVVHHPNIAVLCEWKVDGDGQPVVVSERVRAPALDAVIREHGALPESRAVEIAVQILDALSAAHAVGLMHGDVRPANVFAGDVVKLTDFSIYLMTEDRTRTRVGFMPLGPLPYLSPERWFGEPCDPRADVYAVGATLYEMLTGKRAFPESPVLSLASAVLQRVPDVVSGRLGPIVARALAKDPSARFATAEEMARALAAI